MTSQSREIAVEKQGLFGPFIGTEAVVYKNSIAADLASDKIFGLLRDPAILFAGGLDHLVRLF